MKKTLVVFGLFRTLIGFDNYVHSAAPGVIVKPKRGISYFVDELREISKEYGPIDFFIDTRLDPQITKSFIEKTDSEDVFDQNLKLKYKSNMISTKIYEDSFHEIFEFASKRVFEIQDYDRIILVDCEKRHRYDFWKLKLTLFLNKNDKFSEYYKGKTFAFIYGKSFYKVLKNLYKILEKKEGIYIR